MLRERLCVMKHRSRVRTCVVGALIGAANLSFVFAQVRGAAAGPPGSIEIPAGPSATDSGIPPPELRLRAIVARALDDSIATWSRLMEGRAAEVAAVSVRFVSHLAPDNCYGLYTGDGPAYCSGNRTVFVGTAAANRLMAKFGPQAEAGITFLIGHEIGHHIQNLNGRFYALSQAIYSSPDDGPDYVRRFELQADCLAGMWIHASSAWATSDQFRADLLAVLSDIGDDKLLAGQPAAKLRRVGLHGTTEQRTRWFLRGAQGGDAEACDTFGVSQP
jgi:predicted metalloprotease